MMMIIIIITIRPTSPLSLNGLVLIAGNQFAYCVVHPNL